MYKFLPEQIENLKKQLDENTSQLDGIIEMRRENYQEKKTGQGNEISVQLDNTLLESFVVNANTLNDIRRKLLNCKVIEPNNSDEIGVGSTFEITLNFGGVEDKSVFTLIETRIPKDPMHFISISSPLGKAVIGKKQGDSFKYVVENSVISGKINEIIKTNEDVKTKSICK